jgi:cell division protein FtsB
VTVVRKSGFISLLAIIALIAVIALRGPNGIPALAEKRKQIQTLQEMNASLAADNERKRIRIEKLKHSRAEQELEIRERLKMLRPGETQLILPDQPHVEQPKPDQPKSESSQP